MQDAASSHRWSTSGSSGRRGSRARSCCACARRTPTSTCGWPPATPRPARQWPTCTRASAAAYGDLTFTPYDAGGRRRARPRVPRAAPRRQPGDRAGAARQGRPPRRPGRRLPAAGPVAVPAVVRRGAHRARAAARLRLRPARSCSATRSAPPTTSPRRAATRRPRCWRWRRSCAPGWSTPTGSSWTPRRGVSGAGRPPKPNTTFCTVDEDFTAYGLLDHRHTPEMEQVLGASVLFTPHLAPMNRGILATCYARPTGATSTDALLDALRGRLRRRALRRRHRRVAVDQGDPRFELRPRHRALRRAHRLGGGHRRHRQPHQGRVGRGRAVRQPPPRPPRDHRPPDRRGVPMTRHRARGVHRRGVACGIKPSGDPDLSLVATADGQPVAAAAVFTQNKMTAAPVVTTNAHLTLTGGRAAAVVLNSGCANAATGAPGVDDAQAMCAAVAAELGCARRGGAGVLHRPHRLPAADGRDRWRASRSSWPAAVGRRRRRRRRGDPHHRHPPQGDARRAATASPSAAWPRAPPCSPRTWPRCSPCSPPTPRSSRPSCTDVLRAGVAESFNAMSIDGCTSTNDTVILLASGAAGAARRPGRLRGRGGRGVPRPRHADGRRRRRATPRSSRCGSPARSPTTRRAAGARKVAESQLVKCSWYGEDPYWGRVASELGTAGHHLRARQAHACATATSSSPRAA